MLRHSILLLSYTLLLFSTHISQAQFGEKQVLIDNIIDEKLELVVDLNQDGYSDLLVFRRDLDLTYSNETRYSGSHVIRINDGSNNFTEEYEIKYDRNQWSRVEAIDLDQDGRLDFVVDDDSWLRNAGDYRFVWAAKVNDEYVSRNVYGDVDNDGDLDIVDRQEVRLNDGNQQYSPELKFEELGLYPSEVAGVFDLDNDNRNEILITVNNSTFAVLRRTENGEYERQDLAADYASDYSVQYNIREVVDVDQDGLLDIIYTEFDEEGALNIRTEGSQVITREYDEQASQFRILYNTGDLSFTDYVQPPAKIADPAYRILNTEVADLNNDGFPDIVTTLGLLFFFDNNFDVPASQVHVHANNQDGTFSSLGVLKPGYRAFGEFASPNGNQLLVESNSGVERVNLTGASPAYTLLYEYEQDIDFSNSSWTYVGEVISSADSDNDGQQDIFVGANHKLLWFSSEADYPATIIDDFLWSPTAIDVGDLNGDGQADVIMSSGEESPWENKTAVYLADNGTFRFDSAINDSDFYTDIFNQLYIRDVDNDGDNDIIGGSSFSSAEDVRIFINEGNNQFSDGVALNAAFFADEFLVEVKDVTNDGLVDILAYENEIRQVSLYSNEGGSFAAAQPLVNDIDLKQMAWGDLDGDGRADMVGLLNLESTIVWYRSNEQMQLSPASEISIAGGANDLELVDIDADGDLDIVAARAGDEPMLVWYENTDGNGTFSDIRETGYPARIIHATDLDGDDDTDLVIANYGDVPIEVYQLENLSINEASTSLSLQLEAPQAQGLQQEALAVAVKVQSGFENITSLSFSLSWDPNVASFAGINPAEGFTLDSSGTEDGRLGITWKSEEGQSRVDESTLLSVQFALIGAELSKTAVSFASAPVTAAVLNAAGEEVPLSTGDTELSILTSQAPESISLSSTSIAENQPGGTLVGTFATSDADDSEGFGYALVEGEGDSGNANFGIEGDGLITLAAFDFETAAEYSIRVRTTDSRGKSYEKVFTIQVEDVDDTNNAPTNITLSSVSINENNLPGAPVGTLAATDADSDDTHTFTLIGGEGSQDNSLFAISGNNLIALVPFDYEEQAQYTIRLQATDPAGGKFSKAFTITVNDVDESSNRAPTAISLDNTSVQENQPANTLVGTLTTTDPDADDLHSYALVAGEGDQGNDFFRIRDNRLRTATSFDYEAQTQYSIRLQTRDGSGGQFTRTFLITIGNEADANNQAPTNITLSNNTVEENQPLGTLVGTLLTQDADNAIFSYTLVSGGGSAHNAQFIIQGNELRTATSLDYETLSQLSIRIQTDDGRGGTFSKPFTILISDADDGRNRFPTDLQLTPQTLPEAQPAGALIGTFTTVDADADDQHQYRLVDGELANDNALFTIQGDQLRSAAALDPDTQASFIIRVLTDDGRGGTYEQTFVLTFGSPLGVLAVINPLDDQQALAHEPFSLTLPEDLFAGQSLSLTLSLADDSPLPDWLTYQADSYTLSGTPPAAGDTLTIRVTATDPSGGSASDEFLLTIAGVTALGDEEISPLIRVYPVPAHTTLFVEVASPSERILSYRLLDPQGHILWNKSVEGSAESLLQLDVSTLSQGLYLLELHTRQTTLQKRLLIH